MKKTIVLTEELQKKLDFIRGRGFIQNFPNENPDKEWVGAVLDFIEGLEEKNDEFDSKEALRLAGKMSIASTDVICCSNPLELSNRISVLKTTTEQYDNYIFEHC